MTLRATGVIVCVLACAAAAAGHAATWRTASPDYVLQLPRDHASHPEYRIEWWYYTGNLETEGGRRFGYQVTFFRIGVTPEPDNPSVFAVRDLHIAHAAVTDIERRRHLVAERLNRGGVGWAGASTSAYHVWNEDWFARLDDGRHVLQARDRQFAIDLVLAEGGPPVLHGERGYSRKGSTPGNASHYYSLTRMPTEGHLTIDGERLAVSGASWMDHEFGTSFLEPGQQGWDWFSLQLDDGTELMMFQLRRTDGRVDPQSSGTLVSGGVARALGAGAFTLTPGRRWTSGRSRATYPVEWRIQVPGERLDLMVRPVLDDQELTGLRTGVTYWEGAIEVTGTRGGRRVAGRGYLEMTGYAGQAMGELLR
ncbi:MAG TPA: lipocalin-like domain-containing protein [Vicinamibacterales bacterium]